MKKYLIILSALVSFTSCSSDDDGGCTCIGEYIFFNEDGDRIENTVLAEDVKCETGERPESPLPDTAIFLGCDN